MTDDEVDDAGARPGLPAGVEHLEFRRRSGAAAGPREDAGSDADVVLLMVRGYRAGGAARCMRSDAGEDDLRGD